MGVLPNSPERAYVVAATPRSGSTLLCETLRASGVAGRPEEPFQRLRDSGLSHQPRDYFRGVDDPELLALLPDRRPGAPIDADDARERLTRALAEDTTANGVFATKLMWGYLPDFLAGIRAITGDDGDDLATLRSAFGRDLRFVQVRRRDKVAQAVSLWRAIQTQQWRDEGSTRPAGVPGPDSALRDAAATEVEPVYHHGAIAHLRDLLAAGEAAWTAWFADHGIAPVRVVVYEQLVPALGPTVRELLGELGIDDPPAEGFDRPRMRRQSNGTSAAWRERFLAEEAAGG